MDVVSRAKPDPRAFVALETTLLLHGVPSASALPLAHELNEIVRSAGVEPALVGVVDGKPTVGMHDDELRTLLDAPSVPKANTANPGVLIHRASHAATTVSATMELASTAGVRVFATGGIGGVHPGLAERVDISADLAAFTRFPVAVVTSGTKTILDIASTREALETLGIPVVGFQTDSYPAFYLRESDLSVDARYEDVDELASFVHAELVRTGRGIVLANPIPEADALDPQEVGSWLAQATQIARLRGADGRDVTPATLAALHEVSGGRTLEANLALIRANTHLAARLSKAMMEQV